MNSRPYDQYLGNIFLFVCLFVVFRILHIVVSKSMSRIPSGVECFVCNIVKHG